MAVQGGVADLRAILSGPSIQVRCRMRAGRRQVGRWRRALGLRSAAGMAEPLIRPATAADAAAIAAIYAPYVTDTFVSFEEEAPGPEDMAKRIAGSVPGLYPWLVAEIDERVVGYASSSPFRTRPAYRWTVETGVYLSPEGQGRGVGRALMERMLDLLTRQDFTAAVAGITLPIPAERRPARKARLQTLRDLPRHRLQAGRMAHGPGLRPRPGAAAQSTLEIRPFADAG